MARFDSVLGLIGNTPLVDVSGRLIGINTAIFSRSGGSHGIGFAIPASMVRSVVDSAKGGSRTVRRPWFGARVQVVTPEIAESMGLDRPTGVLIADIVPRGPAEQAGLRRGDLVLSVDGQPVDDPDGFGYRYALRGIGGEASLAVVRGGRRTTLAIRLVPPLTITRDELDLFVAALPTLIATATATATATAKESAP